MFIFNDDFALRVACGKCKKEIGIEEAEHCWYCTRHLCVKCWDEFGECGHPEVVELKNKMKLGEIGTQVPKETL